MTFTQRSYVAANSSAQTSCERHFDQLTDDELVERWEQQGLGGSGVSHLDHVRIAWVLSSRCSREEAESRLVEGTRASCEHYGCPEKFDERLTRRWAQVIHDAVEASPELRPFGEFIAANDRLRQGDLFGRPATV